MGLNGPGVWRYSPPLPGPATACLSVSPSGSGSAAVGAGKPRAAAASTFKLIVAAAGPIWKTGRSAIADTVGSESNVPIYLTPRLTTLNSVKLHLHRY